MKDKIAILVVIVVIALVGFGGYWLGRSNAPISQPASTVATTLSSERPLPPPLAADVREKTVLSNTDLAVGHSKSPISSTEKQSAVPIQNVSTKAAPASDPNAEMKARIAARFEKLVSDDPAHPIQSPNVAAHQLVQSQPVDPDWSPGVNQALSDRLASDIGNEFDVSSIDCRTDICELRASGFTGGDKPGDIDAFQKEIFDLERQHWFKQLGLQEAGVTVSDVPGGGPSVFIVFLTRL